MSIEINNKRVSKDDALAYIKDEKKRISSCAFELNNPTKTDEVTMDGFAIDKETILGWAKGMDEFNADLLRVTLTKIGKLGGKTMEIVIRNKPASKTELWLRKTLKRWMQ